MWRLIMMTILAQQWHPDTQRKISKKTYLVWYFIFQTKACTLFWAFLEVRIWKGELSSHIYMENVYSNYKELNPFFVWSFSKYIFQYQSYSFNYNNEISYKVAWLFAHLNMNNSSMKWSHCISSNFLIIRHEGEDFPFIFDHGHTLFSSTCFKWFFVSNMSSHFL